MLTGTHQSSMIDRRVVTELDALLAYLQVLGTMVDFADPADERLQQ